MTAPQCDGMKAGAHDFDTLVNIAPRFLRYGLTVNICRHCGVIEVARPELKTVHYFKPWAVP